MNTPSEAIDASDPAPGTRLRAGPLSMLFLDGDLRRVTWNGREVIRRIYGAVRDRNWGTVPGEITDLVLEQEDRGFRIRYTRTHHQNDIHFVWTAAITGDEEGNLGFSFDGEAHSTFFRNRIGLCVLHPIRECAGTACRTHHADGTTVTRQFPAFVSVEQPVSGFSDLTGLAHQVEPGAWVEVAFEGDAFETEDQRNWIDASFKTYSPPLRLPFPVEIRKGTRIRQRVTLALRKDTRATTVTRTTAARTEVIRVRASGAAAVRLPEIGLGMASHGLPLTATEADRLSRLGLSHLRADLRLAEPSWPVRLRTAARDAMELGSALELVIHLPRHEAGDFGAVARELSRLKVDLTRAVAFRNGRRSTLGEDLAAARVALGDYGIPIGAGTDADLYQLHLEPPPPHADFLVWSMNPQVHASDVMSIAETPEAAAHQIASMRRAFPGLPLAISPVTLKPRFNPVSTGPEIDAGSDVLPSQVDPRQRSLFGAAWTVAMFKAIAEGGAESVTFFETTGWRGVLEAEEGSPWPASLPSLPGVAFPLFHPLADVGEFGRGSVVPTETNDPLNIASLLLADGKRRRLILANLSTEPRRVAWPEMREARCSRTLDESSIRESMTAPEDFRARRVPSAAVECTLAAHAVVTLDFSEA